MRTLNFRYKTDLQILIDVGVFSFEREGKFCSGLVNHLVPIPTYYMSKDSSHQCKKAIIFPLGIVKEKTAILICDSFKTVHCIAPP